MLHTRLTALSFLMALTLPACDAKTGPDEEEGTVENPAPKEEDFGRAGEACDQSELSAACQAEGIAGSEFCAWDEDTWTYVWTACLTEACSEPGEERACEGGVQYCATHASGVDSDALHWGVCGEPSECESGDSRPCSDFDEELGINQGCSSDEYGRGIWNSDDCNTPLVLDFGGGITFAEASAAAADFAIAGGTCARADWPTAQTPWLALDRDGNGSIDGGHELFGSATRLSAGTGPHNGFQALAELDSDGDGRVTASDARWAELVLWADHDADRRSSGWEMLPLASFDLVEIDLGYAVRRACDDRGNCGLERARFVYRADGQERVGEVVDVRVVCE